MFEHKGYSGRITNTDTEAGIFHGRVIGLQDVITFQGKTVCELGKAFRDSVDDYLEFCEELKESAEKPFSGKFVLRLTPDLHRRASEAADAAHASLNSWIVAAIEHQLSKASQNGDGMAFEEMERLAHCVAAILAEKQSSRVPQALQEKQRPKSRSGSTSKSAS